VSLDGFTFLVLTDEISSEALIRAPFRERLGAGRVARRCTWSRRQLIAESAPDMVLVGCSTHPEEALA